MEMELRLVVNIGLMLGLVPQGNGINEVFENKVARTIFKFFAKYN
jgi:hypothetical protein